MGVIKAVTALLVVVATIGLGAAKGKIGSLAIASDPATVQQTVSTTIPADGTCSTSSSSSSSNG